ncbi:hypothetical protein A5761_09960 [Mycolicibacterium setense]|uniref:nuclear transport factor 2 family protein n=1 Tax=Mycolicibacterium setense TaxID=431269 RepID=UPI0007EB2AE0|nr:nuclear transport factor 2 family protein [Mycolicibacterium setense]OBB17670.1 hypothetical protein A5761_09960 [Mycolicibacterium setense]
MSIPQSINEVRVELRALIDEYALASDSQDIERFGSLFTEDAEFVTTPPGQAEKVTLVGRDQVKLSPGGNSLFEQTFHGVHNHIVDVQGDHATGITYCTARHLLRNKEDDSLEVILAPIRYHDNYVRTVDGWKISRRELEWTWIERTPVAPFSQWW